MAAPRPPPTTALPLVRMPQAVVAINAVDADIRVASLLIDNLLNPVTAGLPRMMRETRLLQGGKGERGAAGAPG